MDLAAYFRSVGRGFPDAGASHGLVKVGVERPDSGGMALASRRDRLADDADGGSVDLAAAFDRHAQEVFGFCLRRCQDRDLAEDLLSVVFLEAWRARDRAVLVDGTLRPWLYGVATNVLRNGRRSMRRHRAALERYHELGEQLVTADHADEVVRDLDAITTRIALNEAFAALSAKDREVADLCLQEGLSIATVAGVLGLPVGTVKSRLAHARAHLQRVLRSSELAFLTDPGGSSGHGRDESPQGTPAGATAT